MISTPESSDNELLGVKAEDLKTYIKKLVATAS